MFKWFFTRGRKVCAGCAACEEKVERLHEEVQFVFKTLDRLLEKLLVNREALSVYSQSLCEEVEGIRERVENLELRQ